MNRIEGVILDWAGTAVDFGCFAPVHAFVEIFKAAGIAVTMDEARAPMGMLKKDHIRAMLDMPRIKSTWKDRSGSFHDENDVEKLYSQFEPLLMESIEQYTDPIPGVVETVKKLRADGLKIGSTTGYTNSMMRPVVEAAKSKGYSPDTWITPDSTGMCGRPYPYMIFRNMESLKLSASHNVVKVGDTLSDIKEGVSAGVWSVGVITGSSQMGLSFEEFSSLSESERNIAVKRAEDAFISAGADFTINKISDLPLMIDKINGLLKEGKRPGTV